MMALRGYRTKQAPRVQDGNPFISIKLVIQRTRQKNPKKLLYLRSNDIVTSRWKETLSWCFSGLNIFSKQRDNWKNGEEGTLPRSFIVATLNKGIFKLFLHRDLTKPASGLANKKSRLGWRHFLVSFQSQFPGKTVELFYVFMHLPYAATRSASIMAAAKGKPWTLLNRRQ